VAALFRQSGHGPSPPQDDEKRLLFSNYSPLEAPPSPLSSRPKRTRISFFALLATTTCAVFLKENRVMGINPTVLDRKSGEAQWRDLRFSEIVLGMFFDRAFSRV
jgi:hypothetical protein